MWGWSDATFARILIVLPAAVLLALNALMAYVIVKTVRDWVANPKEKTIPGGMWQALMLGVTLNILLFAGMDVGEFLVLWDSSGKDIIMLNMAFFFPWLAYKSVKVVSERKGAKNGDATGGDDVA